MAETKSKDMGCWPGFWAGIGGAVFVALLAMFALPGFTMASLADRLEVRANEALKAGGMNWASVTMDGQRAIVRGAAPSDAAMNKAVETALTSSGAGGPYAGGVTAVVNELIVGPPVSPYTWSIKRTNEAVTVSGHVPSESVRRDLLMHARARFGVAPQDAMRVSGGVPGGDWERVAKWGVDQVAQLKRGEARMTDNRVIVLGEGTADAVKELQARAAMGVAPGFETRIDITVEGQGLAIPELKGVDLTNATPAQCTQAFTRLMQNNVINFATDSDVIEPRSEPLLNNLVSVAVRCDSAKIDVEGHTDSTGDAAANFELSQRRANAVRQFLIQRGVMTDRIAAQGFGATRPIAPNTTAAGQAANRRIEFKVTS